MSRRAAQVNRSLVTEFSLRPPEHQEHGRKSAKKNRMVDFDARVTANGMRARGNWIQNTRGAYRTNYEHPGHSGWKAVSHQRRTRRANRPRPGRPHLRVRRAQLGRVRHGGRLSLLIPLGILGLNYILPISTAIIILLVVVYFSYRQTIAEYPSGGGSYTVARANLGAVPGLLAGAALLTDYILMAAVGISAGVGALISAVPVLQPHTVLICISILTVVTILNLRGVRDAGVIFMVPTYLFIGTLVITIGGGLIHTMMSGGHPIPRAALPVPPPVTQVFTYWLLLKAFSSGCAAITGVEAVSNGVKAFREPAVKNAQRTLTVIIFVLALFLAGISYLVKIYGILAMDPANAGYQSVLSLLISAVFGRGIFYYLTIGSILLVLSLSANTAFADFPRLCRAIAHNNYLPHAFSYRGRRLVYTYGIVVLAVLTGTLLIIFQGITDRLIPLYAIGAFLAFTLSQAGMVGHWFKKRAAHWEKSALVNGLGALVTGVTACVVLSGKVHRRRLDHTSVHSFADGFVYRSAATLSQGDRPHAYLRPGGPGNGRQPTNRGSPVRPLEPDHEARNRVCVAAVDRNYCGARRAG